LIIDTLASDPTLHLTYFYFDFRDAQKQTLLGLLASLVFQIATQSQECLEILKDVRAKHSSRLNPSEELLFDCLESMLRVSPRTAVVIDAIDECPRNTRDTDIFPFLQRLVKLGEHGFSLLLTSRPEHDIRAHMLNLATHTLDLHEAKERLGDLSRFITHELANSTYYGNWPVSMKLRAEEVLKQKANGM
jgi:hypothetical protein